MSLMGWIYLLFFLGCINAAIAILNIKGFLDGHSVIDSLRVFRKFRQMVRQQMFQALIQIGILGPMILLGVSGVFNKKITGNNLFLWLLLNVGIFLLAQLAKRYEEPARSIKVPDPSMEEQYKRVCESWLKKPFPDF
ncbi:MAG: hypothetical protein GY940_14565 [bacterium]|nr:hypothetical protein [bacterium]